MTIWTEKLVEYRSDEWERLVNQCWITKHLETVDGVTLAVMLKRVDADELQAMTARWQYGD
jgi:hypothetical protein